MNRIQFTPTVIVVPGLSRRLKPGCGCLATAVSAHNGPVSIRHTERWRDIHPDHTDGLQGGHARQISPLLDRIFLSFTVRSPSIILL